MLLQRSTYACVGLTWNAILRAGGFRVRLGELTRLAVEKLSIDQLVPAVGLSGRTRSTAMRRSLITGSWSTSDCPRGFQGFPGAMVNSYRRQ